VIRWRKAACSTDCSDSLMIRICCLLSSEAKLAGLLRDSTRALSAMRSAFETDPRNSLIAVRLAKGWKLRATSLVPEPGFKRHGQQPS